MTINNPKPLSHLDGNPAFDELWQAQVLSMVDALITENVITPVNWSESFGKNLNAAYQKGDPDNLDTYFSAALTTLEKLITDQCEITKTDVTKKHEDWRQAYLSTPHGKPVQLS
ncbi:hypothetical protein [Kiloniella spongiae]|uniref:hypothetical protein n=1 Tax=Kiloniella spongiae TaxID=1489064 RepID=UPI00069A9616|nr:hypothetical protein [Kiloniella spongiae]